MDECICTQAGWCMAAAQVLWLELLVEEKSRINACELWDGVHSLPVLAA